MVFSFFRNAIAFIANKIECCVRVCACLQSEKERIAQKLNDLIKSH